MHLFLLGCFVVTAVVWWPWGALPMLLVAGWVARDWWRGRG